jgi:hypothetical protein
MKEERILIIYNNPNSQFNNISSFNKIPSNFQPGKSTILRSKEERDQIVKLEKQKLMEKWRKIGKN